MLIYFQVKVNETVASNTAIKLIAGLRFAYQVLFSYTF